VAQLLLRLLRKGQPTYVGWATDVPGDGPDGWLCTYYVYDDLGNLRFVIPPKAVDWLSVNGWAFAVSGGDQVASELCFRYEYDERGRMVVKKVPGKSEDWMVYDVRDRQVFSQDGNQRTLNQWINTQYDELNRTILVAQMTYQASRLELQQTVTSLETTGTISPLLPADLTISTPDQQGDFSVQPAAKWMDMKFFETALPSQSRRD